MVCGAPLAVTENDAPFVTVVDTGFVAHDDPDDGTHPGPDHNPVFEIVPDADGSTVTWNDTATFAPAATPEPIVHVIVPSDATLTVQLGNDDDDNDPHDADPATNAVPAGASSVIVTGASDVDTPLFVAVNVYVNGVDCPAVTDDADTDFTTENDAGARTWKHSLDEVSLEAR